jgi:hypothetical protein
VSVHINDAVIWQESEGGISLYNTESGEFRTLNATAAEIWVLLEDDGEREPVIEKLSLMFAGRNEALASRIRGEVDAFISSMVEAGLLEESEARA